VTEINTALQSFWDNYRCPRTRSGSAARKPQSINKLVIAGGGAPLFRFNVDGNVANQVIGGSGTKGYFNQYTQTQIEIRIHPYLPAGTMLFTSKTVPYPHPASDRSRA
jgi:hypothetical protein